jgi:hypothetical protein
MTEVSYQQRLRQHLFALQTAHRPLQTGHREPRQRLPRSPRKVARQARPRSANGLPAAGVTVPTKDQRTARPRKGNERNEIVFSRLHRSPPNRHSRLPSQLPF